MYGELCQTPCECDKNNTKSCHPFTGKCDCNAGWSSNLCNRPCPFLKYGENCANDCNCNGAQCSSITGECICAPGYQGNDLFVPQSNMVKFKFFEMWCVCVCVLTMFALDL